MDNLSELLIGLELRLHTKEVKSCRESLNELLADDFSEIGANGQYFGKQEIFEYLPEEDSISIEASEFEVRELSHDIVHITYKSNLIGKGGNLIRTSYRTSVWKQNGSGWQMVFHQGTVTT